MVTAKDRMESEPKFACSALQQESDELEVTAGNSKHPERFGRLALFESRFLPTEEVGIAFVGGPVGALQFHPYAKGICALSAHRQEQCMHEILRCYEGDGYIQLWDFSASKPSCLGVIPHNGDCAWDLKWKPDEPTEALSGGWRGTLAASLGDGTVMVTTVEGSIRSPPSTSPGRILASKTMTLRKEGSTADRVPVRVLQWSDDGGMLVVGTADGSLEIYGASSTSEPWSKWSIPGHESVVMDLRWISKTHLCTLGLSCVLRLRDIRDPVSTLEQNAEGLSGSLSMDTLEPNVAAVGGDYGYLRVVRLSGADGVTVKLPVKRVYLQVGSFRDMKSIPVKTQNGNPFRTLLYTGGAEGIVHECTFPRPIWSSPEVCNIGKTKITEKLRWSGKKIQDPADEANSRSVTLHLEIAPNGDKGVLDRKDQSQTELTSLSALEDDKETGSIQEVAKQRLSADNGRETDGKGAPGEELAHSRKSRAVGKASDVKDCSFFGEHYNQKAVITRISVSEVSNLLAVSICGGFVTWMPLALERHAEIAREEDEARKMPVRESDKNLIKPPRKRGRPRKIPLNAATGAGSSSQVAKRENSSVDCSEAKSEGKAGQDANGTPSEVKAKSQRGRRRLVLPVFGPKRKRGRPRKQVAADESQGGERQAPSVVEEPKHKERDPQDPKTGSHQPAARHALKPEHGTSPSRRAGTRSGLRSGMVLAPGKTEGAEIQTGADGDTGRAAAQETTVEAKAGSMLEGKQASKHSNPEPPRTATKRTRKASADALEAVTVEPGEPKPVKRPRQTAEDVAPEARNVAPKNIGGTSKTGGAKALDTRGGAARAAKGDAAPATLPWRSTRKRARPDEAAPTPQTTPTVLPNMCPVRLRVREPLPRAVFLKLQVRDGRPPKRVRIAGDNMPHTEAPQLRIVCKLPLREGACRGRDGCRTAASSPPVEEGALKPASIPTDGERGAVAGASPMDTGNGGAIGAARKACDMERMDSKVKADVDQVAEADDASAAGAQPSGQVAISERGALPHEDAETDASEGVRLRRVRRPTWKVKGA